MSCVRRRPLSRSARGDFSVQRTPGPQDPSSVSVIALGDGSDLGSLLSRSVYVRVDSVFCMNSYLAA